MKMDDIALVALCDALAARGIPAVRAAGAFVKLDHLPLDLHVRDVTVQVPGKPTAVSATFDARARDAQTLGVCVLSVGYGKTPAESAREAAEQWLAGVFPVVESWLTQRSHVCGVTKAEMVVAVEGFSEQFGWSVHLGPVLQRVCAPPSHAYSAPDVPADIVFRTVFSAIHPLAAHKALFWLECFAARYPDGKVDATVRFRNDDWPEGQAALLGWAAGWPDTDGCLLTRRQFLMFEPVPVDQIPAFDSMKEALEQRSAALRPWWKRLFARGRDDG
ncbi:MAG: hypothetical protein KC492_44875 [Myxococcales bacterium]|nr:hypothetical protein [Myxococcales bacterium]